MKNKKRMDETNDSRTYKMYRRMATLSCSFCPPHKYENARMSGKKDLRCWKNYRDRQFRIRR